MTIEAPLSLYKTAVKPEWMDYNQHLNVAYYGLIFDKASEAFFEGIGMDEAFAKETGGSWVVLEGHTLFEREARLGDQLAVTTQVIGHDAKRLHLYHEMHHAGEGGRAATIELMCMFLDLNVRRSAPFPASILARLEKIAAAHADMPRPEKLGRSVGL